MFSDSFQNPIQKEVIDDAQIEFSRGSSESKRRALLVINQTHPQRYLTALQKKMRRTFLLIAPPLIQKKNKYETFFSKLGNIDVSLASHQHFVKKEEKRSAAFLGKRGFLTEKEEHSFGQKKTKTDRHNNTTNSTKLARYQYRLNMN